jgi:hypothetical protein
VKGGAHYRYKNKDGKTSWAFSKGAKNTPFVIGDPEGTLSVHESQWDALSYYGSTGEAALATRGAANARQAVEYIKANNIKTAVAVPQNDKPGRQWLCDLASGINGDCELKLMRVPAEHKDLGEWLKSGATDGDVFNSYIDAKPVDKTTVESMAAEPEETKAEAEPGAKGRKINFTQITQLEMEAIRFVDFPLFQSSAFHMLVAKKGQGKGTFMAAIAARFTRGELGDKSNVLWIACGEDSYSLDVKPRLVAAGGVTDNFYYPEDFIFRLPEDIPALQEAAQEIGNVGLIVIDPLSGAMSSTTNSNMDTDVRTAIAPLNELASRLGCVVVGVRHLRKNISDSGALDSILGSVDFANIPRAVLAISPDDEDEDKRHVGVISGNRVKKNSASRAFRIIGVKVTDGAEVTKAIFLEGPGKNVDDMLKAPPADTKKRRAAMSMLTLLERAHDLDEALESDQLTADVMEATGASLQTVKDAKTELKKRGLIAFVPDKDEDGKLRKWKCRRTNVRRPNSLQEDTEVSLKPTTEVAGTDEPK